MNPYAIYTIIGAVLFFAGAGVGWHERVLREPALLESQKEADEAQCKTDKQTTKEANDALQKDRDIIATRLHALELRPSPSCIPVAGKTKLSGGGHEHAGQNGGGLSTLWLRQYAAECEGYRTEVITCTNFIDNTWKAAGQ